MIGVDCHGPRTPTLEFESVLEISLHERIEPSSNLKPSSELKSRQIDVLTRDLPA